MDWSSFFWGAGTVVACVAAWAAYCISQWPPPADWWVVQPDGNRRSYHSEYAARRAANFAVMYGQLDEYSGKVTPPSGRLTTVCVREKRLIRVIAAPT